MRYAFYFDQTRCMSCNSCSVSCKDWNQVNPGPVRWRKVDTYKADGGPSVAKKKYIIPNRDMFIELLDYVNNVVFKNYVDRSKCIGLQLCITACPFAAPHIADDKQEPEQKASWTIAHPMQKCDMCMSRVEKGEKPVCVASCVGHALDFGDFETLKSKYRDAVQLNSSDFPYAYANNTTETGPSMLIKKRTRTVTLNNGN